MFYEAFRSTAIKILFLSSFTLLFSCSPQSELDQVDPNPFEVYLSTPDEAYSFELAATLSGDGYEAFVLRMVSQKWLTEDLVDEPEWWHWLTLIVPDVVEHSTALLWIGGGSRGSELPSSVDPITLQTALATRTVTAHLHNIPFQPLSFTNDERLDHRYEDDLIAYGWRTFLDGGAQDEDAVWLSRFPMTKAAIRAMDTISEFTFNELGAEVDQFVVAGASKRGWTTWTTAIFDDRVVAIAPVVIDLLNLTPSFQHHWQAYGEWSPAIREYEDEMIMDWLNSKEYNRLLKLVDPYSYLDRLTMPKFIINAASDEFFLPDSWKFYWDDLLGEKAIRYVANAGHSMEGTDAAVSLAAFHNHVVQNRPLPTFEWKVDGNRIEVQLDRERMPDQLQLWSAVNPDARDFRLYVIDRIWTSLPIPFTIESGELTLTTRDSPSVSGEQISISDDGIVTVEMEAGEGFKAWFLEGIFDSETQTPLRLTTGVVVTPDEYLFAPFVSEDPKGTPLHSY